MEVPGLFKAHLGQVIKTRLIKRTDVADGTKGRAILLSKEVMGCMLVYTPEPAKGVYFIDQQTALQYGMNPRFYYIIPVGRLNTDAKGNVLDGSVSLEYLRLGESQYNKFASELEELDNVSTIALTKESKGEFSYVAVKPSSKDVIPQEFKESIKAFADNCDDDTMFAYALTDIAQPFSNYLELLKSKNLDLPTPSISLPGQRSQKLPPKKEVKEETPSEEPLQIPDSENEFDDIDEFNV